ncbi:hypothetical protein FJQ98_14615 [Lysinibacillus agricola]|uniref:Holin n=1 Tax=Lysinibacillus agricola TaxID=2590012 RepID=A0ABX7AL52_9BACI|nr:MULTISPECIES: hypothetical protein [Lysinibacillus]QQP10509.1 hypothetical protein FJQ98_14615 [Lysinibacillus agricola]
MSLNALLLGVVAGVLTFIVAGEITPLIITNTFLGFITGKLTDKNNQDRK